MSCKIMGYIKTTLLDYPGKVASTIFLGGCNFRCGYCHNSGMLNPKRSEINLNEITSYLSKRKNIIDGVCISGGEPTFLCGDKLHTLCKLFKSKGLLVKLDTNGTNFKVLKELMENKLIDYVAMDIKTHIDKYEQITNTTLTDYERSNITSCVEYLILCSGIDYEFRTTIANETHTEEDIEAIGKWLHGAENDYLQQYKDSPEVLVGGLYTPCSEEKLKMYKNILSKHIYNVRSRNIHL